MTAARARAAVGGREPLRVLFVTSDTFPPSRPVAKTIFAEGLTAAGYRIDWLLQAERADGPCGAVDFCGGTAFVAPTDAGRGRGARVRKQWLDLRNDLRVLGLLRTRPYSLVQIKGKYLGALLAIAAAKIHGVPVLYWLGHAHDEAPPLRAPPKDAARHRWLRGCRDALRRLLLHRLIIPACAHTFVQSEQMRLEIRRKGVPLEKTTAVPRALSLADLDAAATVARNSPRGPTIAYLGTLPAERRLDFLVRVLARVVAQVPDARLEFIGAGGAPDDEALLRREARRLGVAEAVSITGWLPQHTALQHVRRAAVCVSPCLPVPIRASTSPTGLLEYMALGKPVVANDHPEQTPVLLTSGAGLVCAWDESQFAAAIVALLQDPGRAAAMGGAGRRYVAEHRTHPAMVKLVASRYQRTLSALPSAARTIGVERVHRAPD